MPGTAKWTRIVPWLVLALLVAGGAIAATKTTYVTIATGGTAGTYYPLGGAMAQIFEKVPGVKATAQATQASVANVNLLNQGQVELALIQNDIAFYAHTGTEMFDGKPVAKLRGVSILYPETVQIVTTPNTGIRSVADLKGKRVAVGAPGSGTEANARQILAAHGLSYKDMKVDYLSFGEAANNLKDRHIDAAFVTAGFPTAAVTDIAASNGVVVLDISDDALAKLRKEYPFYTRVTLPAGTYAGQSKAVQSAAVMAMLATTSDQPQDLLYSLTKVLFENLDVLGQAHQAGKRVSQEKALDGMPIPVHPGSQRYYDGK